MEKENQKNLKFNNLNESVCLNNTLNKTNLCLNKNSANEENSTTDLDLTLELENEADECIEKKKTDFDQSETKSLNSIDSNCNTKNKKRNSIEKTNVLNKSTNSDNAKSTEMDEKNNGKDHTSSSNESLKNNELHAKPKSIKRKRNAGDSLTENEPNDLEPNSKKRRITSKTPEERKNFFLKKLRKCAFHAGIVPPYKKLFENVLKTSKQIEILKQFLVDKGITKPITLEKCQRYKIQKEIEAENEILEKNVVFESVSGKRVTRSSRKSIVKKRSVVIDDSESEEDTEQKEVKNTSVFLNLAGIVSSDEDE